MPASRATPVLVYADGSCEGNPGPGGWGVVIIAPDGTHRLSGGDPQTTNNRMEVMAAIEALRALEPGLPVILRSDSQYLVKTMNEGWRRTKNADLWKQLDAEVARHNVRFEWVRGHAGDSRNEEADQLAREAARSATKDRTPRRLDAASADTEDPVVAALRPLLGDGERIARCAGCGRAFVARDIAPRGGAERGYCALAACQLRARGGRAL